MTDQTSQANGHLPPEQIALYLSQSLAEVDRRRIEAHLNACEECRREVVQINRLVRAEQRRRRRAYVAVPLSAAAALLLFFTLGPPGGDGSRRVRGGREAGQRLEVVQPADAATLATDSIRFVWKLAADEAQYALQITDSAGDVIFSESTADTVLTVAVRRLRLGETYFWYVDALFRDGESATTDIRHFTIEP